MSCTNEYVNVASPFNAEKYTDFSALMLLLVAVAVVDVFFSTDIRADCMRINGEQADSYLLEPNAFHSNKLNKCLLKCTAFTHTNHMNERVAFLELFTW